MNWPLKLSSYICVVIVLIWKIKYTAIFTLGPWLADQLLSTKSMDNWIVAFEKSKEVSKNKINMDDQMSPDFWGTICIITTTFIWIQTELMDFQRTVYSLFYFVNMTSLFNRVGQSVAALLRRLGLDYQGNESRGKIRISGLTMKRWFLPKLASPFTGKPEELGSSQLRLGKGIAHQQRNIRTGNLSLD